MGSYSSSSIRSIYTILFIAKSCNSLWLSRTIIFILNFFKRFIWARKISTWWTHCTVEFIIFFVSWRAIFQADKLRRINNVIYDGTFLFLRLNVWLLHHGIWLLSINDKIFRLETIFSTFSVNMVVNFQANICRVVQYWRLTEERVINSHWTIYWVRKV